MSDFSYLEHKSLLNYLYFYAIIKIVIFDMR